jgi:hypothetical protein
MHKYTEQFLATLLEDAAFTQREELEEGEVPENDIRGAIISEFSESFVAHVERFILGFVAYLQLKEIPYDPYTHMGAEIYMSLSGHGAGFFDDSATEHLQEPLERYAGSVKFYELRDNLWKGEDGRVSLAIKDEFLEDYLTKQFTPVYDPAKLSN